MTGRSVGPFPISHSLDAFTAPVANIGKRYATLDL